MGPLKKLTITTDQDIVHATEPIQTYARSNNYKGFIMSDAFDKIITNSSAQFIPQEFNGSTVFISAQSFQQNNKVTGNQIRKYVRDLIRNLKLNDITCIGGESYLYGLTGHVPNIYAYTNSPSIYADIGFNARVFSTGTNCQAQLCDYNKINQIEPSPVCLINLSSLYKNLMGVINKAGFEHIIIISCHHEDFWKKIKFLPNYKIKSRKQFIAYSLGYFLTISILYKK
jgi:hypothetical protein